MINLAVTPAPARKLRLPDAVDRDWSEPGDPLYLHPDFRDDYADVNWTPPVVLVLADPCRGPDCWHHTREIDDTGGRAMRWADGMPVLRFGGAQ